ncbi:MAG: hypothetical protein U0694_17525 [Anaerolineae bacterium]
MGISVTWDNVQQTTLLYSFEEPWGWADFDEALRLGYQMMEGTDQKVGVIIDLSRVGSLPRNAIQHLSNSSKYGHPNQHTTIYVGMSPFVRAIFNILVKVMPRPLYDIHSVETLKQARTLMNRQPWIRGLLRRINH